MDRFEGRIYNRHYYEITDEMDEILRTFAPNAGEPMTLVLTKTGQPIPQIFKNIIILGDENEDAVIRVTNLQPRLRGFFEVRFSWSNGSIKGNKACALVYLIRDGKFTDYDYAKEEYENTFVDSLPKSTYDFVEVCEHCGGHQHVRGKPYAPEGWEELKAVVSVIARQLGREFDPDKVVKGWTR